jgi:predicted RNA-binding protein with PIN domain
MRLIVDAMNVIGTRPDGWWRDRRGAMRRLVEALAQHAAASGDEVTAVLDSRPFELDDVRGAVEVRFAPGARNAADDEIVRIAAADTAPATLVVATSDRELAARVRDLGADVMPASALRARLDRPG